MALYTTVYPGVEAYLADWYRSVQAQTDRDFDLWIGLDALSKDEVYRALGSTPAIFWQVAEAGDTPAQVRQRAIAEMVAAYEAVLFVDSDDLLHPSRVAAARSALAEADVGACALNIINETGQALGVIFSPSATDNVARMLPSYNVFGLSNTAYRSDILQACLPIPPESILIDWLLATRAWALGATMIFDETPHMAYRQYSANIAPVLPPFTPHHVVTATERVLNHYHCILAGEWSLPEPAYTLVFKAYQRANQFYLAITSQEAILQRYVEALNRLSPQHIWWWTVAHPDLEEIWNA